MGISDRGGEGRGSSEVTVGTRGWEGGIHCRILRTLYIHATRVAASACALVAASRNQRLRHLGVCHWWARACNRVCHCSSLSFCFSLYRCLFLASGSSSFRLVCVSVLRACVPRRALKSWRACAHARAHPSEFRKQSLIEVFEYLLKFFVSMLCVLYEVFFWKFYRYCNTWSIIAEKKIYVRFYNK